MNTKQKTFSQVLDSNKKTLNEALVGISLKSVVSRTKTALMFKKIGLENWTRIAVFLNKMKFSNEEVERILFSKEMRRFDDEVVGGGSRLNFMGKESDVENFKIYYKQFINDFKKAAKNDK